MFDILIKNGLLIDGTGAPGYRADLGIENGKITYIGKRQHVQAKTEIDAAGKIVAPGFIDAHSHGDGRFSEEYPALSKISQGVTTEMAGQCGFTAAPVQRDTLELLIKATQPQLSADMIKNLERFDTFANYVKHVKQLPLHLNAAQYVGHIAIRAAVMGCDDRKATPAELAQMKTLVREAMESGAMGLSTGLIYAPGSYADTEELIELCKVIREYDGIYATHIRNESDHVMDALNEAIEIARAADVPLWVSHLKAMGRNNWGRSEDMLNCVDKAIASGMKITMDQYPYEACMSYLNICIPPQYAAGGGEKLASNLQNPETRRKIIKEMTAENPVYDNFYKNSGGFEGIQISWCPAEAASGKYITQYAREQGKEPFDAYFDLLIESKGRGFASYFSIGSEDVDRIAAHPCVVFGSDGLATESDGATHPRSFGTFPQAICRFVKERKVMSLEQAIQKMTLFTAQRIGLKNRGALLKGFHADVVIFDYDQLEARASYSDGHALAAGIEHVLINGTPVYNDGAICAKGRGQFILREDSK